MMLSFQSGDNFVLANAPAARCAPPHTHIDVRSRRCLLKPLTYILHHTVFQPGNGWAAALPTQTGLHHAVFSVCSLRLCTPPALSACLAHTPFNQEEGTSTDTLLRTAAQADSFPVGSLGSDSALNTHLPLPGCLGSAGQRSWRFSSSIPWKLGL